MRKRLTVLFAVMLATFGLYIGTSSQTASAGTFVSNGWSTYANNITTAIHVGDSVTLIPKVMATTKSQTASVKVFLYDSAEHIVGQQSFDNRYFTVNTRRGFTTNPIRIPTTAPTGVYHVRIGAYSTPTSTTRLHYNVDATHFTVTSAVTTTTTIAPATTTTIKPTTTTVAPTGHFATLPPHAVLPSEAQCAAKIKKSSETRPTNAKYNANVATQNGAVPGVTGNFAGTTDDIIEWAACTKGIDEDVARAQAAVESWWDQEATGDFNSDPNSCHPDFRTTNPCPESIGLTQVRYLYHTAAFTDKNAIKSTAYNVQYLENLLRDCYNGNMTWLNDVEHVGNYAEGDLWGCVGVWFSGRWHTDAANTYIAKVQDYLAQKIWTTPTFLNYRQTTTTTTAAAPATTTTVAPTTTMSMPMPTTTVAAPTTTAAPAAGTQFSESFTGNTGLENFRTGIYYRNIFEGYPAGHDFTTMNPADHDMNCGSPDTKRMVDGDPAHEANMFYNCKDHMMTVMPDVDGYSIAMFAPKQTFSSVNKVCWDVNLTNELAREWWDVSIVPTTAGDYYAPSWLAGAGQAGGAGTVSYLKSGGVHFAWGPFSHHLQIASVQGEHDDTNNEYTSGKDLATRFTNCAINNNNGTATFTQMRGTTLYSYTAAVTWPTGKQLKVVFGHHAYTPDKDGVPISYTFHWDAIQVS